jgi:hypothetical protein
VHRFDTYLEDAGIKPFDLEVSDDEVLSIPAPDSNTILLIEEAASTRERLRLLCGEHFERVMELIGGESPLVMRRLTQDMTQQFSIDPKRAPLGGSGASSS